jgi:hypothetical protein
MRLPIRTILPQMLARLFNLASRRVDEGVWHEQNRITWKRSCDSESMLIGIRANIKITSAF